MNLQAAVLKLPQEAMPVKHHFAQGVYARELHIRKGVVLVGRVHLHSQVNIVSKGDISVLTETGVVRFKAGDAFVSPPGVKRAGYAHEDTIWTTILGTDLTDHEEIINTLTAVDYDGYEAMAQLELNNRPVGQIGV